MRILALDPGATTGIATFREDPPDDPDYGFFAFDAWWTWDQMSGDHHEQLYQLAYNFLRPWKEDNVCVMESFEFRQHDDFRTGVRLESREYIGVMKLFGQITNTPVVLQTAGHAKGFIPDKARGGLEANAKLKVLNLYRPGMKHANDAMRHLVTYLIQKKGRKDLFEPWRTLV